MDMRNSSRSFITPTFSSRLSLFLLPNFLVSPCPAVSLFPHDTNIQLAICTRLPSPHQPLPLLLCSIHMSLNQEFWVLYLTTQWVLAMMRISGSHTTFRRVMFSLALLMGRGCWQGLGVHTVHTTSSLKKLAVRCHKSDHLQTGFPKVQPWVHL